MNLETLSESPRHFETHHENSETLLCMQHGDACSIMVETSGTPEEQRIIERAAHRALSRLDTLFDGKFAEAFSGLLIKIGDDLTESGGEAFPDKNEIVLDRRKMLLSLLEAEALMPDVLDQSDWSGVMSEDEAGKPGSCIEYNIINEVGHILDEQAEDRAAHHVNASESPTKYGRQSDQFHEDKDHEAFAEGFTYKAYNQPITEVMNLAVSRAIEARVTHI